MMGFIQNIAIRFALVFGFSLVLWGVGGMILNRFITVQNNTAQLEEAAQLLMSRAERAVDFVVIAGTELTIAGKTRCGPQSASILRDRVLATGMVSNLHLVTPDGSCSSFAEGGAALPDRDTRAGWNAARNPAYRIGPMQVGEGNLIGVSWGLDTELELVTAIHADPMLFDVLPAALRTHGRIYLSTEGQYLSSFSSGQNTDAEVATWPSFAANGARYPLKVEIKVDPTVLANWRHSLANPITAIWMAFGALLALGCAFAAVRGRNQALEAVVRGLTNQEITAHFQPIVDVETGQWSACEALARWTRSDGTTISPGRFISLVEEHGLNDELLSVMIEQTATKLRTFLSDHPDFYVSFNVTPDQLSRPDFADFFTALARQHLLAPNQICVEITERQVIHDTERAAETTTRLAAAGFKLAIDDAGTGHNGLAAIQQLQVNTLKIDKFFVDHVDDDPRSRVMVDMFVSVAKRYDLVTVAEGVETERQLAVLKAAGVALIQGFVISKPLPADAFLAAYRDAAAVPVSAEDAAPASDLKTAQQITALPVAGTGTPNMPQASPCANDTSELARLEALYRYQILDTEEEEIFDRIPRIVKNALDGSFAAIALVDADRRWFKAVAGGKRGNLPRSQSFCNQTIKRPEPTVVEDTHSHDAFRDNILVVNAPFIRSYLGVPLQTTEGHRIGSLCCVDRRPRQFTPEQIQLVKDLSTIVMDQLEMRMMARFDPLTSARNRLGFRSEADPLFASAKLQGGSFSMLMLDIDHFKQVNDGYGHKVGDEILTGVGRRISAALGEHHVFGRMGGEEFAIAMPNTALAEALDLAEKIRAAIDLHPFATSRGAIPVTISIGVAIADALTVDLDELLEQADWALYQAKAKGRNRVVKFVSQAA